MSALTQIVSRVVGGGGRGRSAGMAGRGTTGMTGAGRTGGRRSQDEAIGRGVRGLLRRFR